MEGYIERVQVQEEYDSIETSIRSNAAYVRRRPKLILTIVIDEPMPQPEPGARVVIMAGKELKEFAEAQDKRIQQEKADRDRMVRMNDDHPGWSGCPDCGQLPCVCNIDPKLF
jgi:hypothetical protein